MRPASQPPRGGPDRHLSLAGWPFEPMRLATFAHAISKTQPTAQAGAAVCSSKVAGQRLCRGMSVERLHSNRRSRPTEKAGGFVR
jgi:hypothetical protein